jgi:hypothetical protein
MFLGWTFNKQCPPSSKQKDKFMTPNTASALNIHNVELTQAFYLHKSNGKTLKQLLMKSSRNLDTKPSQQPVESFVMPFGKSPHP